jgi:hypothetical protein
MFLLIAAVLLASMRSFEPLEGLLISDAHCLLCQIVHWMLVLARAVAACTGKASDLVQLRQPVCCSYADFGRMDKGA